MNKKVEKFDVKISKRRSSDNKKEIKFNEGIADIITDTGYVSVFAKDGKFYFIEAKPSGQGSRDSYLIRKGPHDTYNKIVIAGNDWLDQFEGEYPLLFDNNTKKYFIENKETKKKEKELAVSEETNSIFSELFKMFVKNCTYFRRVGDGKYPGISKNREDRKWAWTTAERQLFYTVCTNFNVSLYDICSISDLTGVPVMDLLTVDFEYADELSVAFKEFCRLKEKYGFE